MIKGKFINLECSCIRAWSSSTCFKLSWFFKLIVPQWQRNPSCSVRKSPCIYWRVPIFFFVLTHIEWTSIFFLFVFYPHNTHTRRDMQANFLRPKICILLVDIYFHPCGWLTLAWQGQITNRWAAIHLMSPCWFGQTSSGKQSLQQGWAERITCWSGTIRQITWTQRTVARH